MASLARALSSFCSNAAPRVFPFLSPPSPLSLFVPSSLPPPPHYHQLLPPAPSHFSTRSPFLPFALFLWC